MTRKFLKRLFKDLRDSTTSASRLRDLIMFLQELCNLAKNLQVQSRVAFYQTLTRHDFMEVLGNVLSHQDVKIRLATVNILDCAVNHDPTLVRQFMLTQKPKCELLTKVMSGFLGDVEMGIRVQLTEVLRILIDTANIEEVPEKDEFLSLFYSDYILKMIEPLSEKVDKEFPDSVKESICEILGFCVTHHGYRIKYFLLGNNITGRILTLLKSKQRHLILAAIRFFRAFVGMKDDFYNRHLTKRNLFDPIIEVFKENGPKYNLLNSAIIELFEFIRKENIKHLIQHVVEHYGDFFKTVTYVDTFKLLVIKHEQNQESPNDSTSSTPTLSANSLNGSRENNEEDEEYFNTDDEEDASVATDNLAKNEEIERKFKPLIRKEEEEEVQLPKLKVRELTGDKKETSKVERKLDNGKKGKISINLSGLVHKREDDQTEDGNVMKKHKT